MTAKAYEGQNILFLTLHYDGDGSTPLIQTPYANYDDLLLFLDDEVYVNYSNLYLTPKGFYDVALTVPNIDLMTSNVTIKQYAGSFDYIVMYYDRYQGGEVWGIEVYYNNDYTPVFNASYRTDNVLFDFKMSQNPNTDQYYQDGYDLGYKIGSRVGRDSALAETEGYYQSWFDAGYDAGKLVAPSQEISIVNMLFGVFAGIGTFLSIELLPGVSFGVLLAIPIIFGLIYFFIGKRGGD